MFTAALVISIEHNTTVHADMRAYAEVLVLTLLVTGTANLAGFLWVNFYDGDTGPFCLVLNLFNEAITSELSGKPKSSGSLP